MDGFAAVVKNRLICLEVFEMAHFFVCSWLLVVEDEEASIGGR